MDGETMRPIFVVGKQRSGTSWLANVLSNHNDVAAVINYKKGYEGIHESSFFSHVKYHFGDLRDRNNYIEFIEAYKNSDYFKLLDIKEELLYSRKFNSYEEFFDFLMNHYTKGLGKNYWLEKTPPHALHMDEISSYFSDAKFIAIKRNINDVIRSYYKLKGKQNNKYVFIIKEVFRSAGYDKHIKKYSKDNDNIICIEYNDLLNTPDESFKEICEFIGINYEPDMKNIKYMKNSSFKTKSQSTRVLSFTDKLFISLFNCSFSLIPYTVYRLLYLLHIKLYRRKLPNWFYDKKKNEIFK